MNEEEYHLRFTNIPSKYLFSLSEKSIELRNYKSFNELRVFINHIIKLLDLFTLFLIPLNKGIEIAL